MKYLSVAETARLIRPQLKQHFPKVKFSVRSKSYSGGASLRISWTNGPTQSQVESISGGFSGAGFDGMIDLKYHVTSWLMPDGSAETAKSPGTTGSMGADEPTDNPKPHPDAEEVSFGADFIFCQRTISPGLEQSKAVEIVERYGCFSDTDREAIRQGTREPWEIYSKDQQQHLSHMVHRAFMDIDLQERTIRFKVRPTP